MNALRQTDRAFGLMMAGVLGFIFLVAWLVFSAVVVWLLVVAVAFGLLALIAPGLLLPINRLWALFALKLSVVSNFVIMGLFYFVIILPVGILMRLFGGDPMRRRPEPKEKTYYSRIERHATAETLRDMF